MFEAPMLRCGRFELSLERPLIMGIVNLTSDSFSGDGMASKAAQVVARAQHLVECGADIIDLGAESTRPGSNAVSSAEELRELLPVLDALAGFHVPISIDTNKPEVMSAVLEHGASMINDVYALRLPGAVDVVAQSDCGICLMHMQGEPRTMQTNPVYQDVVGEVRQFLSARVLAANAAGISHDRIVLDPGFGFGKKLEHNTALIRHMADLSIDGLPILAGLSRKSMLGEITGKSVNERLSASVAVALLAAQHGAKILRVHDVAETRDALMVLREINQ